MLLIVSQTNEPEFNIAAEELILKNIQDDVIMLYVNKPSVIVGKHQNTYAEINYPFIRENNIPVIRRLSGGGTVYHDFGNVNFTFVMNGEEGKLVDFAKFTEPVILALGKLGVDAVRGGRNDLIAGGKKISGNAEHVFKRRTLHHGTLLFSSDLGRLEDAIRVKPGRFKDKAVQSVRSRVANISPLLATPLTVNEFVSFLAKEMEKYFENNVLYSFSPSEVAAINKLVSEKYSLWDWNYGYSPGYELKNLIKLNGSEGILSLSVEKGIIRDVHLQGSPSANAWLIEQLPGLPHRLEDLKNLLTHSKDAILQNLSEDQILSAFF